MKVYGVFRIDIDSLGEILDCIFKFIKPVPHKTSAIERRCIVRIYHNNLIEVFQCQIKLIATHLLPYCSQMMQCRYILRLQLHSIFIILFTLFEFTKFIPAKGPVIESFEMLGVNLNRIFIIFNCIIKLFFLSIGETSVVVEVSLAGFYLDGF
jgi:hypothetical protein